MTAPLLRADDVSVALGGRPIVTGATLSIARGELVALIGPNGAGKTTLMRALAGLVPASGTIALDGAPLASLAPRKRARRLAYLPQGHVFHWPLPVAEIVALGRTPHADAFAPLTAADRDAVARALAVTGISAFAERRVPTRSGGERARVALARALATEAPLILADEPTASLDARHQLVVMELLRRAAHAGGGVVAIVHDLTLAARFADRVVVIDRGRIVADGPPADVLTRERLAAVFGVDVAIVDLGDGVVPVPRHPL